MGCNNVYGMYYGIIMVLCMHLLISTDETRIAWGNYM